MSAGTFDLYPAIDLRGGRCVRLYQGDYGRETVYGEDPVAVALGFVAAGVRWIHVVDLDAARSGVATNHKVIAAIATAVAGRARLQSGGGVRSVGAAQALADSGVDRVVVGTAAIESPELVAEIAQVVDVAVGFDVRGSEVAVRGWTEGSGVQLGAALDRVATAGASATIITQIARDGTLAGPDVEGLTAALELTELAVIASGGVGTAADLAALAAVRSPANNRALAGVITGRALYEGRFSVEEAVAACAR